MPGIYDQIVDDFDKAILVSGVSLNGELQDDAYASVKVNEGSVDLTVYGGVVTVTEDDEVTFVLAKSNTELTEDVEELTTIVNESGNITVLKGALDPNSKVFKVGSICSAYVRLTGVTAEANDILITLPSHPTGTIVFSGLSNRVFSIDTEGNVKSSEALSSVNVAFYVVYIVEE